MPVVGGCSNILNTQPQLGSSTVSVNQIGDGRHPVIVPVFLLNRDTVVTAKKPADGNSSSGGRTITLTPAVVEANSVAEADRVSPTSQSSDMFVSVADEDLSEIVEVVESNIVIDDDTVEHEKVECTVLLHDEVCSSGNIVDDDVTLSADTNTIIVEVNTEQQVVANQSSQPASAAGEEEQSEKKADILFIQGHDYF